MFRFIFGLTARLVILVMVGTAGAVSAARLMGSALAIQYGQFFPPEDMIFFHYVDADHRLDVRQRLPVAVVTLGSTSLSPDGSQRVTAAQNADSADLFVVLADGTRRQIARLSHHPPAPSQGGRKISSPVWSPDGAWISFITLNASGVPELTLLRPDGSGLYHIGRVSERGAAMLPRWVRLE